MRRLMFYSFLTTVISLLSLSTIVYSGTFTDTFDDPNFTNNNWMDYETGVQQTWSFPLIGPANYGYHVSTTSSSPPAAKSANNGIEYYSTDLYIEALVRIDSHSSAYSSENIAGLAFSMTQGTGYFAAFELDFEGYNETVLQIGIIEGDRIVETPVNINFDTFYKLAVNVDANQNMHAFLYELNGTLLGNISASNILSIDRGAVGMFGGLEVTFDDYALTGSPVGQTGSLSQTQITQIYVATFNRAPDAGGLNFWANTSGLTIEAIAKEFFKAPETQLKYPEGTTDAAFVNTIYQNVFGRDAEPAGLNYWVNVLSNGWSTRDEMIMTVIEGARNKDLQVLQNKTEVGLYYVEQVGGNHIPGFKFSLADITANPATITDAKNAIDHLDLTPSIIAAWSMHRHDARNTGRSAYAGPSGPVEKWRFMLPSTVVSASPVIGTDGTIYMSNGQSGSGGFYAINPDGTQKWLYPGHSGDSAPAISTDGTVYMPGYRNFNAINPDGTLKWTYQAQNVFNYSSPTIGQDGTIYIGCGIDLLALNPGGTLLWQYRVGDDINSTPAVALDGTIYVRSGTDYLCAVNRDGSQKWKLSLGSNPFGYGMSPVIAADGTIYTNGIAPYTRTDDSIIDVNSLYAIKPDGSTKWVYNAISPGGVGGIGTLVPALDLAGNIYLGGKVNDLWVTSAFFALNPSGTLLWSYEMPHPVSFEKSSPAVDVNGIIYFGATNYLYALNPNGTLKWKLPTDIGGSSPAIGSNGTLYFGSGDGYLNAIGN